MFVSSSELSKLFTGGFEDVSSKNYFWINEDGEIRLAINIFNAKSSTVDLFIPSVVNGIPVRMIREAGFYACQALRTVYIHDGVEFINDVAFGNCKNLTSVRLPSTIKICQHNAFEGCYSLNNITIDKPAGSISGYPWGCPNPSVVKWVG